METKQLSFRKASEIETETIKRHIKSYFGDSALSSLFQKILWVKEGKIREVYIMFSESAKTAEKITVEIYSAGIPIGSFHGDRFELEIEGATLISPYTDKEIQIKTDQFLYGKPIFTENVIKYCEFKRGDYLIVRGKKNLLYGIGKAKINSNEIPLAQPNTILIKEARKKRKDRGWYLREGD